MVQNKTKDILMDLLLDMDDFARMRNIDYPPIYLLGGSGCIIAGYLDRATTDVDFLDMDYNANIGRIFKLLDQFDMLDLYLTTIPLDFADRATKVNGFRNIFVLSIEDIIISKIGRYSEKDIEDISVLLKRADRAKLLELIQAVKERKDISQKVMEAFNQNVGIFRERFNV